MIEIKVGMMDICLCGNGEKCLKKRTCKRFKLLSIVTGYYSCSYFYKDGEECKFYIKYDKGE